MKGKRPDSLSEFKNIEELSQWVNENPEIKSALEDRADGSRQNEKAFYENVVANIVMWASKQCSPENAKTLAKNIGYNDSPIFFAKRKKAKLVGEMMILNTAFAIHAVNQVFDYEKAKVVIDQYLAITNKSIFPVLEKLNKNFKNEYEEKISDYFSSLKEENPLVGTSYSFLTNLGINPVKKMENQIFVASTFGNGYAEIGEIIQEKYKNYRKAP